MKTISSKEIYEDMDLVGTLSEKFVKESDPSVVIGEMLEQMDKSLSYVRKLYRQRARDRNQIAAEVATEIGQMMQVMAQAKRKLEQSHIDPEDVNRDLKV